MEPTITISPATEIARLNEVIIRLRESLQAANAETADKFIDFFRLYMENEPDAISKKHDDEIEPFFRHVRMLTRDSVFHRLVEATSGLLPDDPQEAVRIIKKKIKGLQGRLDGISQRIVATRKQGEDPHADEINEFVLRLLEISEVLDSIREITMSLGYEIGSQEFGGQMTAYEMQLEIQKIVNTFITAAGNRDYVTIHDTCHDLSKLLSGISSIMDDLMKSGAVPV